MSYEYKLIEKDNDESNWQWATIGTIDDLLNMPDELVFKHSLCIGEGKLITAGLTMKRETGFYAIDHASFESTILEILGNDEYYDFFDYFKNPVFCHHIT